MRSILKKTSSILLTVLLLSALAHPAALASRGGQLGITWEAGVQYSITFNANGGMVYGAPEITRHVLPGTSAGALPVEILHDYMRLRQWNTRSDGGGEVFTSGTTVNGDMTVYAQWGYEITFVNWDGTPILSYVVRPGDNAADMPANASRTGHSFTGWSPAPPFNNVQSHITSTAQFSSAGGGETATPPTVTPPTVTPPTVTPPTVTPPPEPPTPEPPTPGPSAPAPPAVTPPQGGGAGGDTEPPPTVTLTPDPTPLQAQNQTPAAMRPPVADIAAAAERRDANGLSQGQEELPEPEQTVLTSPGGANQGAGVTSGTAEEYLLPGRNGYAVTDSQPESVMLFDGSVPLARAGIGNTGILLFAPAGENSWALVNLILGILALALALASAIRAIAGKRSEDEEQSCLREHPEKENRQSPILLATVCVLAIVSAVIFIVTQDMRAQMALFDWWTLPHAVMFTMECIISMIMRRRRKAQEHKEVTSSN